MIQLNLNELRIFFEKVLEKLGPLVVFIFVDVDGVVLVLLQLGRPTEMIHLVEGRTPELVQALVDRKISFGLESLALLFPFDDAVQL